jgi:hypothetical protein
MKAVKYLIGTTLVLASFVSCTTTTVVSPENNIVPLQSIAKEGDTLLVIDANSEREIISSLLGDTISGKAERITLEITPKSDEYPLTDFDINAVLEGKFPSFLTKVVLSGSSDEMARDDGYPYYIVDGNQVGVLKTNMLGYSTQSYASLAAAIDKKGEYVSKEDVLNLYNSDIGFFALKPQTIFDLGLGLTQPMIQHMDSILIVINTDGENVLSATFNLDSDNSAKTLNKLVKMGYIGQLKKAGEKLDYSVLKIMFTEDGDIVNIKGMPLTDEQMVGLTDSITSTSRGK